VRQRWPRCGETVTLTSDSGDLKKLLDALAVEANLVHI
jgi:hypothetical protein